MAEHHPTTDWYKLFAGVLCLFFVLSLLQVSRCSFNRSIAPEALISNLSCGIYIVLGIASFFVALLPISVGLEHARTLKRKGLFFHMILLVYLAGFATIIYWTVT